MKASTCLVSIAVLSGIAANTSAQNVLLNAGYEAGSGSDAADWAEIVGGPSGTVGRSDLMPNSGTYSAYMAFDHINNPAAGGAYFIEQVLPASSIDPLSGYDLSFYAKTDSTNFTGMDTFFQILWLDQDGSNGGGVQGEMLTSLIGLGISDSYQQFSMNGLDVPDGADSLLIRFQISAGAVPDIVNGLYVDDVSLTLVPAPASVALLGLSGLLAARRRR